MINLITDFFSQRFLIYALLISLNLGLGAALLSPFLVFNRQSNIADGLSHVAFTGIIVGMLSVPSQPLIIALPIAIAASIGITFLGNLKMIEQDSSIGVISALFLAAGLIIISVSGGGFSKDIDSLLRGVILSTNTLDVVFSLLALFVILIFVLLNYRKLISISYDTTYAKFSKVKYSLLKYTLSALTAVFIVLGVRTIGMLLISSFIIFPALIGSQVARSFKQTILISSLSAIVVIILGAFISFGLDLPFGSTIVVVYGVVLFVLIIIRKAAKRT